MLNHTPDNCPLGQRMATVEADIPWIRESLERLEHGQKELHKSFEQHLQQHRSNGPQSRFPGQGGNGGVTIIVSRKALAVVALAPLGAGAGGVGALLKFLGVI